MISWLISNSKKAMKPMRIYNLTLSGGTHIQIVPFSNGLVYIVLRPGSGQPSAYANGLILSSYLHVERGFSYLSLFGCLFV